MVLCLGDAVAKWATVTSLESNKPGQFKPQCLASESEGNTDKQIRDDLPW